jgi:archaellum component FlaC
MGEVFKAIRERVDDIENDLNRFLEEGETDPWFF